MRDRNIRIGQMVMDGDVAVPRRVWIEIVETLLDEVESLELQVVDAKQYSGLEAWYTHAGLETAVREAPLLRKKIEEQEAALHVLRRRLGLNPHDTSLDKSGECL